VSLGFGVGWVLWSQSRALTGSEAVRAHADAIRTGLAAAAGTGAALALLLAVRRQRSTELALDLQADDLAQKEQVATANAHDAAERRITELYAKAVEQLGSDKAPVRLGGLHALERLAHDNISHRGTIVDVLCAYLRMPYTPNLRQIPRHTPELPDFYGTWPDFPPPAQQADREEFERREQELQVRQTAQRILASHLRPDRDATAQQPRNSKFWPDIDLDLTGAYLVDFSLGHCEVATLKCNTTTFAGESVFRGLVSHLTLIQGARFIGGPASDTFMADFRGARFTFDAWFSSTAFAGQPRFHEDEFFSGACFGGEASFTGVIFNNGARFDGASFEKTVDFTNAHVRSSSTAERDWPDGWVESSRAEPIGTTGGEHPSRWHTLVRQSRPTPSGDPGTGEPR
jgi:hypothetical protein